MNYQSKLILGLGLLAAPFALLAMTPPEITPESYRPRFDPPVPINITTPVVSSDYVGQDLTLRFVVDRKGRPQGIRAAGGNADSVLVASVTSAVMKWRFIPACVDGKPTAHLVELPVFVVERQAAR